jgi:hypothetical protein
MATENGFVPTAKFVAVEMSVAVVTKRRNRATLEGQQRSVRAFGRSCRIPCSGQRPHALHASATQQTNDIDLVRTLAKTTPAALLSHQPQAPRSVQSRGTAPDHALPTAPLVMFSRAKSMR